MLETKNPQIDVNDLLDKIGVELEKINTARENNPRSHQDIELEVNDPYSWGQLSSTIDIAAAHANAGSDVTSMLHHRGLKRRVAQFIGKIVIFLGRVITIPQRNFNNSMLHVLRITLDGIKDMNRGNAEQRAALQDQFLEVQAQFKKLEDRVNEKTSTIEYLKTGLATQERRVSILLEELRHQISKQKGDQETEEMEFSDLNILDPLYLSFENQFRGSRQDIRHRLEEYLPLMRKTCEGKDDFTVLDIGCGRGEWLELLQEHGFAAKGVDLNHVLVEECREMGFDVTEENALTYLQKLPDNSLGVITAFHLIEHLPFDALVALYDESARVLKPGGIALFETPNPKNLLVGACNFWADPTHLKPLYPDTQQFIMEYRGFTNVELLYLHPHDEGIHLPVDEAPKLGARLNDLLSNARDYALVGHKV